SQEWSSIPAPIFLAATMIPSKPFLRTACGAGHRRRITTVTRTLPPTFLAESPTSPSLTPSAARSCGRSTRKSTGIDEFRISFPPRRDSEISFRHLSTDGAILRYEEPAMGTLFRPFIRLLVGFVAIPLFRLFLRRVIHLQRLD